MFLATDASSGSGVHEGREYEELRESGKHDDRGDQVVVDDMLPLLQAQVCKGIVSQEIIYEYDRGNQVVVDDMLPLLQT